MSFDIQNANVSWVKSSGARTSSSVARDALAVSVMKSGKNAAGEQRYQNAVILPMQAMQEGRIIHGDRVMIGTATQSGKKWLVVTRTNSGEGYKVSRPHQNSKNGYVKFGAAKEDSICDLPFPKPVRCPLSSMQNIPNGFALEISE